MAQAGSGQVTEANPLGLALSFVEGTALVTLQDRSLGRGVSLRALELELAEVDFPLDLEGGAEAFQRRSTRLVHLVLEVDLAVLAESLQAALSDHDRSLRDLRLVFEGGRLILEARLGADGPAVAAELLPGPCDEGAEVHIAEARVFGPAALCTVGMGRDLEVASRAALEGLAPHAAESVAPRGPWVFTFDPIGALLWNLLPRHGWKLPEYQPGEVRNLAFTSSGAVQLVVGVSKAGLTPPAAEPVKEQSLLAARAREDQDRVVPAVEAQVSSGAFGAAFDVLEQAHASAGGDRLFEQLLAVGVAEPTLAPRVSALVADRLEVDADHLPALLTRAALASRDGHAAAAQADYEQVARGLRRLGLRRRAGLAYRAAAQHTEPGSSSRARLLEETIALRPDDVRALEGLVQTLPQLGRASAAVRAARRLANLSTDAQVRVDAHLAAARLLLEQVQDSAGAKREWERALKLAPEHPEALEGLAQALTARGDPRRAASILDKLIQQAERAEDAPRAARLCLQLGDLWQPLDAEAARTRYRRAHELMPDSARPVLALAQSAHEAGDTELAMDVLDAVVPKLGGLANDDEQQAVLSLHLLAGQLYAQSPDRQVEAVAQLEAALQIEPEHDEALVGLTDLHMRRGDHAAAAEILSRRADRALKAGDPDTAAALWSQELEEAAGSESLSDSLRPRVQAACAQYRSHRGLLDLLVQVSLHDGPACIEALDRRLLLEDPPERRSALWVQLAEVFEAQGQGADAIRAYEEALAAAPQHRGAAVALVKLYRARADEGRLQVALARAADLAEDPQEQAGLHAERARLLEDRGDEGEAWSAIQGGLKAQPEDLGLLNFATRIALKIGQPDEARGLIERRLALQAEQPPATRLSAYVDLAKVEELCGDRPAVLAALQQAYEAANANSVGGRRLAARLAAELSAQQRYVQLAALQRDRGQVETSTASERAHLHLEAARLFADADGLVDAEDQVKAVLDLADKGGVEPETVDAALEVLEAVAAQQPDPGRRARVLVLKAQRADGAEADTLRLEAADLLQQAGRLEPALTVLKDAGPRLEQSRDLLQRLGDLHLAQGQVEEGAQAFARTADLAVAEEAPADAVLAHGRAAQAFVDAGQPERALSHDRAVLELSEDHSSAWMQSALTRLEAYAREQSDSALLSQVLGRQAEAAPPSEAAELLLAKANLHIQSPGQERKGLDALRRAHGLAPRDTEIANSVAARLAESLQRVGLFAEQAAVLSQWAEQTDRSAARAERLYLAAEVYASRLRDRSMALSRAQAAVRAHPGHEAARSLRIALLREDGRTEALAEALAEEAAHSEDAEAASARWLEAAELVAPPKHVDDSSPEALTRALELVRRAATAAPSALPPLQAEVRYSRALGRPDEELSALGRLVERDLPPPLLAAARLRRAHLLRGALGDDVTAQGELDAALSYLLKASPDGVEEVAKALPDTSRQAYEGAAQGDLRRGALIAQLEVTELLEAWPEHVALLMTLIEDSEDASERADLRVQAGEILEWRMGDGAMAEREYLTALATDPSHVRARRALAQFYTAVDRFADLAESLGVETLVEVFEGFADSEPVRRVAAAAEALWPQLPEGSSERADVQLRLAKIYEDLQQDADVVHVLEQVDQTAPRTHRRQAVAGLRALFEARERDDLLVDVLRRQAELIDDDAGRAAALAELGEALEWKLGDGQAAEREYRAALAVDPQCGVARLRLAELLSAEDRFPEVSTDLGQDDLRQIIDRLIEQGPRDRERVFAASAALAEDLEPEARGEHWLMVAEALEASEDDETARTKEALEAAVQCAPTRARALDKLCALLGRVGDRRELAQVISLRAEDEDDVHKQIALRLQQARLYIALRDDEQLADGSADVMAEGPLRIVLALDPEHPEALELLTEMLTNWGQWRSLGELAGDEALARAQADAEVAHDPQKAQEILQARSAASEGADKAARLVDLVAYAEGEAVEELYREALEADPASLPAQEGLRALYESQARFRDIGQVLSVEALRSTLQGLKSLDHGAHLLPATLALATVLEGREGTEEEQVRLYVEAAALHLSEDDEDAAEHALRSAVQLMPDHAVARDELSGLLVRQGRLEALADVDPTLVAAAATRASQIGDQEMEIRALRVLASRREGREQADTLVLVAALEKARAHLQAAEEDLTRALEQDPEHSLARSELESILWASGRHAQALQVLGPQAFLRRAALLVDEDPEALVEAVQAVVDDLDDACKAEAFELCAAAHVPGATSAGDRARRLRAVQRAKGLWDGLDEAQGSLRCRVVLVDLAREGDDVDALLEALEDALQYAKDPETRAALSIERATLLALTDDRAQARTLVEGLVSEQVPEDHRRGAARMLVEDLLDADPESLSLEDLDLRTRALEVLTAQDLESGPEAVRWLTELAQLRELSGEDSLRVVTLLEAALDKGAEGAEADQIRAQLRGLYEELGDWKGAERHASVIAEAQGDPDLWVQVSELRVWLDDRKGAEAALQSALQKQPGHSAAHASFLRLAEQSGERASVIARLESWVASDEGADDGERVDRLLRALSMAVEDKDEDQAARLAERAVDLAPAPRRAEVVDEACKQLQILGAEDAQVGLLSRVVSTSKETPVRQRLMLVDALERADRMDEARTVLEAGIHRDTPQEDPLVERVLSATQGLADDQAARRLLSLAERLKSGPAARRFAALAAQKAESAGENELARTGWQSVIAEVGAGSHAVAARQALVRLARDQQDDQTLLSALLESVDDADSAEHKAARLVEAAQLAEQRLAAESQAEALYRRARKLVPDDRALAERFLEHLQKRERWPEVDAELRDRAEAAQGAERARLNAARAELTQQHFQDDLQAARLWVQAYEAEASAQRGIEAVLCLQRAGVPDEALTLTDRVLAGEPEDSEAAHALIRVRCELLESLNEVDSAIECLEKQLQRGPQTPWVQARLRAILVRHHRYPALAKLLQDIAPTLPPGEGLRTQLAAARVLHDRCHDDDGTRGALQGALTMVEGWLGASHSPIPDDIAPPPLKGGLQSERLSFEAPLLDLAALAASIGDADLRVAALRVYAQSLNEGLAQWRVLLMLGGAEREAGDLDAAEFTLRGVVEAIQDAEAVDVQDRAEAERALGALLLARGDADGAVQALSRAEGLLRVGVGETDAGRAEVLVQLGAAHRAAGTSAEAVQVMLQARLLDPEALTQEELHDVIESAGPSQELAHMMVQRASEILVPSERAARLRAAAGVWEAIGRPESAYGPLVLAYEADPSNSAEASRLEELLYEAERWHDLEHLFRLRLEGEDLTDDARRTLLVARARLLESQLDRAQDALALFQEASATQPRPDVLQELARLAGAVSRPDVEQDALARLAALADTPEMRRSALLAKAKSQGPEQASAALSQAFDLSLEEGFAVTPLAERLAGYLEQRGDYASVARLWVRVAGVREGPGAAAAFARAGQTRLDHLDDRRGAASAFEAACRRAPEDLGLRRAALSLSESLGDWRRAEGHARKGAEVALAQGRPAAAASFARSQATALAACGRPEAELEVWGRVLDGAPSAAGLDALVARAREALPAEQVEALLATRAERASDEGLKVQLQLARARVLDDPLGRHWEAEGLREDVAKLRPEASPALDAASTPHSQDLTDADYRTMRSMLDRSGRWSELAELEEQQALRIGSRTERARALMGVAALHRASGAEDLGERVKATLLQAVALDPGLVEAQAELLRAQIEAEDWAEACETLDRLDELGGPPWPVPKAECLAADVAMALHDMPRAKAALVQALDRDPHSVEVLARLARLDPTPARLRAWAEVLDPVLDCDTLAEVAAAQAEAALEAGERQAALTHAEAAVLAAPRSSRARTTMRRVLSETDASAATLVEALVDEAQTVGSEQAAERLQEALTLAEQHALKGLAAQVATTLGALPELGAEHRARLATFWRQRADGPSLIRAADLAGGAHELQDLSGSERAQLGGALIDDGRVEEGWMVLLHGTPDGSREELGLACEQGKLRRLSERIAAALSPDETPQGEGDGIARPELRARLRAHFLDGDAELGPYALAGLTRCVVLLPGERGLAECLASTLRSMDCVEDAAVEYRALLVRDPVDLAVLESLGQVLPFDQARGPQAVQSWLQDGAQSSRELPRLAHALSPEHLHSVAPLSMLSEALVLAAEAMLGPAPEVGCQVGGRLAEVCSDLIPCMPVPLSVTLDEDGGMHVRASTERARTLIVGQALVQSASDAELRFAVARSAYLEWAGASWVDEGGAAQRLKRLHGLAEELPKVETIGEEARARLQALAPELAAVTELDLGAWRAEAQQAAARFGLLACGDLRAAVAGLDHLEPRALAEPRSTISERCAAVRRWGPITDIITWTTQMRYADLLSCGAFMDPLDPLG